jgi:protein-S-isoprenylcysteine O-methyltransferase Ste14
MTPLEATRYIWLIWVVTWFAAAIWSDRTVKRPGLRREFWYRLVTVCGALLLFGAVDRRFDFVFWRLNGDIGWLLVAMTAAGVLLMWWARLHLGRLWSGSITRKADHRVIDTGPYAIVRHPIYTSLALAVAATVCIRASAQTLTGAALLIFGIYIKAKTEERFLRDQLGADAYDAYARRVPMLLPSFRTSRNR